MASSSSSHKQNRESNAFSEMEPGGKRGKVFESSRLFDVFINHRGADVKETLATELYNSLRQLGIEAFLDSQEKELRKSFPSTIETAIRSAKVHIAIFSPRYAESPSCLAELLLMIESKVKIIPVFYEVEPWELRHIEKGRYAGAFIEYEKKGRYLQKLNEWKEALRNFSFIGGVEFHSFSDYKTIIAAVEKEVLQSRRCLHVAKYPVGLNNLVEDFERRCLDELVQDFENQCGPAEKKSRLNAVGIFGMGGVGKTTLAKELFNRKLSEYSRASFLFDVGEASARGELPRLQSRLVKDLFNKEESFTSIEEGISYINSLLPTFPLNFLIVLDDIDHVEQLDALLIMDTLNKSGNSLIIVTTRDVGVMISAGITNGYSLKGMDRNNGKQLFCWQAFGNSIPIAGYEALVEQFVDVCGGLPLSLLVLGQLVHGRDLKFWKSNLVKAKKTLPIYVQQKLKISFDALEDEEKQVFMDIACFFSGKRKRIAERILEGSGWGAQTVLQTLKDKCLIEEIGDYYRMHDLLRNLGREIALELSPPHRRWHPQHLKSLESKGFRNILAQTRGRCFHSFMDESMDCQITYFTGEPEDGSDASLLWLQLDYQNRPQLYVNSDIHQSIPTWIPLRNLLCLRISGGCFPRFWQNAVQSPLQLRELRISQCFGFSSLPVELSALQSLEHLEVTGCPTLSSLSPHFGTLRNLQYLDLSNCEQLEELPDSFYQLMRLESIRLSYCGKLKVRLDMLKNITKLKYLDLTGCHLLGELPRLVPVLPLQLIELRISQCFGVSSLPEELCDLKSLQILELSCCPMLSSLPSRFGDLRNLRHLDLSCCWKLKLRLDMLENITMLEYLNLTRCHEVEELPHNISYQANLKRLFMEGTSIKDLPANIGELRNLEELKIGSPMLTSLPPSLGELTLLNTLVIDGCVQLQDLPQSLCNLDLLKQLTIRGSGLKELPFGVGSSNIEVTGQQVDASNSGFNSRASVPGNCRQTIWNMFKRITEKCLKAIWNALKCLLINKRRITEHGSPQTHVHNKIPSGVETLSLVANPQLMEIQVLPESLKNLEIYACRMLRKMSGVDHLLKLHRLEICSCPDLEELPSFAGLTSLQEFKIEGCPKLIIQGLEFSKSLQILTAKVPLIRSLENAEELTRIELTSHTMSSLKPCILSMKKCPREAMIRAIVGSNIVQSLPLNNLSVLRLEEDSEWDNITQDLFIGPFLWYQEENVSDNDESGRSGSKVVQIAVCRGGSSAIPEYCVRRRMGSNTEEKQCKAVLGRGDGENVVAAFSQLIRLLE